MSGPEHDGQEHPRSAELQTDNAGTPYATWHLTSTHLIEPVRITLPPVHALPIIFVPGIMGSNLCDLHDRPVWLLNGLFDIPADLVRSWRKKKAGFRQAVLHPKRTRVYANGAVPSGCRLPARTREDYISRGWGEISQCSYHEFLVWLDGKLNATRNPAEWSDFSYSAAFKSEASRTKSSILPPGLVMTLTDLPEAGDEGKRVDQIKSDDLLKRARFNFPVYAFGYNWLASNQDAASELRARIERVIAENNKGNFSCKQVILVTHSMGGLVARACSQLPGMATKILGVIHGVMPATGAPVAYRRCKVGMGDEDPKAAMVIGSDGPKVAAVFAQAPGALQLLPSEAYGTHWLAIKDASGAAVHSLPRSDPYEEIYLRKNEWWSLIREDWLSPEEGIPFPWSRYAANIERARQFHRDIVGKYHPNTFVFYGGGPEISSFSKVQWRMAQGGRVHGARTVPEARVASLTYGDIDTDGTNALFVGSAEQVETTSSGDSPLAVRRHYSDWSITCGSHDSPGDGTVPACSGSAPLSTQAKNVRQQFQLAKIEHEGVYRKSGIAKVIVLYAITKLAAKAELP